MHGGVQTWTRSAKVWQYRTCCTKTLEESGWGNPHGTGAGTFNKKQLTVSLTTIYTCGFNSLQHAPCSWPSQSGENINSWSKGQTSIQHRNCAGKPRFAVLHFTELRKYYIFTNWRSVAILNAVSLPALFFQPRVLTSCVCITFW